MSLAPGTRLGPYEVLSPLGAGGMGEVCRARDVKLGREVALKVLPDEVASDPERLERFEREARTLAALNHPHIAQVYGFEDSGAVRALVMELVPGESLAARIGRGPVPLREALDLARQIADGLGAAHEKGIVHRDIKPANVQVTPEGVAKVLDFGLAKPGLSAVAADEHAATITSPATLTRHGVVLGTAAYMSPEQARGLPVDARADVWAFGALLYELLSGTRPFPGPSITDTLVQVLEREPDWATLPATTPSAIRALLRRCLQKSPQQRLRDIADAKFTVEDALAALSSSAQDATTATGAGAAAVASSRRAVWRHPLPLGLALSALALGGALVWSVTHPPAPTPREPQFLSLMLPPDQELTSSPRAISPDGLDVVYVAVAEEGPPGPEGNVSRLYHRRLTEPAPRALPGTEGAFAPFFSPDGAWVAFASPADLKLKKIALAGGGPIVVADLRGSPFALGQGTWTADGMIVFGEVEGQVRRVPAAGGVPEVMVPRDVLEGIEMGMIWPAALPGGTATIFETTGGSDSNIAMYTQGKRRTLVKNATQPRWSPTGHLLYLRIGDTRSTSGPVQSDLVALAFDATRAEPAGSPVAVLSVGGALRYDLSRAGTLLYAAPATEYVGERVTWITRDDGPTPPSPRLGWNGELATTSGSTIYSPRLSPTGDEVLYYHATYTLQQLMIVDPASGHQRIFATGGHYWAIWTPDGRRVIYQEPSGDAGGYSLAWKPVDGSAAPERLTTKARGWQQPQFVTRDGRSLVYQESGGLGAQEPTAQTYDLWLLPLEPRGEPRPLLRTTASERLAHLSPDQKWMAYVSDETGRSEVWVRVFPEGPVAIQVSQEGGTEPLWAPDGRTLYYRDAAGTHLFAVPVTAGAVPQFGTPSVRTGWWEPGWAFGRMYDISRDGRALLMPAAPTHGRELKVVFNFDEVIRRKLAEAASR